MLKVCTNIPFRSQVQHVHRSKMSLVVRKSSKSPQQLNELMDQALITANSACNDPSVTDTECMMMWEVVEDISKAYNKARDEVLVQEMKDMKPKKEFFLIPKQHKKQR